MPRRCINTSRKRSRGCSAPRRSSGTSPSSSSTAMARSSSVTRRMSSRRRSPATSRSCCDCRSAMESRVRLEFPARRASQVRGCDKMASTMPPKRKSSLTLLSGWCLAALATMAIAAAAPTPAADLNKTLRVSFPIAETGFDPAPVGDIYSQYVNRAIFDPLYRYDYLARPYKIVPNAAAAMPQITPDGKTWTIKIKPGIYFADDPAFNCKQRDHTEADYVYSWKRVIDPKMRSNNIQVFDGKIVGAEPIVAAAKANGRFD